MTKALFFDIDGTLVSFNTHQIPHSTIQALIEAKKRGVQIYISTGRPFALINNIDEIKELIDGYITTNGAYCFIGKDIISCNPIPDEDVTAVLKQADEMDFACMIVGEQSFTFYRANEKVKHIFRRMLNVNTLNENDPLEPILKQRILQLTPVITIEEEQHIMPLLQGCISSRWCPEFADITAFNANKGNGLTSIIAYQGLKVEETMAFGDGGNDISIIQQAGIGVAMGNANQDVKKIADYVAEDIEKDGIYNTLRYFGIIG